MPPARKPSSTEVNVYTLQFRIVTPKTLIDNHMERFIARLCKAFDGSEWRLYVSEDAEQPVLITDHERVPVTEEVIV